MHADDERAAKTRKKLLKLECYFEAISYGWYVLLYFYSLSLGIALVS